MRKKLSFFLTSSLFSLFAIADSNYSYTLDLTKVVDDKISVELITPTITEDIISFYFPAIVPGTYEVYNFGRFISDFKAYDKDGNALLSDTLDINTYQIKDAKKLYKISYLVDDTWDTDIKTNVVFEPGGTNIEANKNFVLNTFGFFGYFKSTLQETFKIEIKKPKGFYGATGLSDFVSKEDADFFTVKDYHLLADSPIMYCLPDTATIKVGDSQILISVFSPNKLVSSKFVAGKINTILNAQKEYLGGTLPVKKYAFIIYLIDKPTLSGSHGALEHSYSSFYVLSEQDPEQIAQTLIDISAHEFFHIVTPLNIHSKEIGDFDFNKPIMSKHLWLYEGMTEYAAHHVQVKTGLTTVDQFLNVIKAKMITAQMRFNDTLPFTVMSKGVLTTHKEEYGNVYEKGALIGLCLDIKLRSLSKGKYGTQDLMRDLSKSYGKEVSFDDDKLFDEIEKLTYPEIRKFLDTYVAGNKTLPFEEVFKLVGIDYAQKLSVEEFSFGNPTLGFDMVKNVPVVFDIAAMDDLGKELGYKEGDEIDF